MKKAAATYFSVEDAGNWLTVLKLGAESLLSSPSFYSSEKSKGRLEMRIIAALTFASAMIFGQIAAISSAQARCTNSYDTASDGSSCGGRASGCRSGGRGGYC